MSVSDSWREDRDGYAVVAGDFRLPVGEFEQGQGERGQSKHQHAVDIHPSAAIHSHGRNTYPPHFNYIENSPRVEYVHEVEQSAYLTSTGAGPVGPVYDANANSSAPASFFPELSLSPSPSPGLELYSQNSSVLPPTSNCSLVSSPVLGPLDGVNSRHQTLSEPGPILKHTPSQLQYTLQQQTSTPILKRKRGRPPKNPNTRHSQGPSHFTTFNNGFAMTFTEEDDYRVVGENEFEKDGVPIHPIGDAITLDPKKRAERQRANSSAIAAAAAASRGRTHITNAASSTVPDPKGKIVEKTRTVPMRSVKTISTSTSAGGGAPSRARRGGGEATPNYNHYSDDDEDSGNDDDDDDDHDNFSGPSSSNSSSSGDEDQGIGDRLEALPERVSTAGHSLRARGKLVQPDRLKEYVSVDSALRRGRKKPFKGQKKTSSSEKRQPKSKRLGRGLSCQHCHSKRIRCDTVKPKCGNCVKYGCACVSRVWVNGRAEVQLNEPILEDVDKSVVFDAGQKPTTQREDIRLAIQQGATKKRFIFFRAYEHLFLPLLPERNFITKLKEAEDKEKAKRMETRQRGEIGMETDCMKTQRGNIVEGNNDQGITEEDGGKTEAVPYKLLEQQPSNVKAIMKPYQLAGLSFLLWLYNNGASGLLGDEMGLGKTLQTLSLFSYLTEHHPSPPGHHRPFLVVCPLSVLSSWMSECKRWTPHLRAMRFHGPSTEKERMKRLAEVGELGNDGIKLHPFDVVVTTYEVFEKEVSWFRRAFVWRYVVLDEGHKIKNEKTLISQAVQGLSAEYRLVLTGTPLQNNLKELWALLHFVMPEVFTENTQTKFTDAFDLTLGKVDRTVMDDSRRLLELIMLRRMKDSKGVNLGLPPKREVVLALPLTPMQRFWYKRLLTRLDRGLLEDIFKGAKYKEEAALQEERSQLKAEEEHLAEVEEGMESMNLKMKEDSWKEAKTIMEQSIQAKTTGWQKLMNLLMQLRKCCSHPYLLPGASPEPYFAGSHIMLASSKIIILDRLIDDLCIKQGRKVLIFSGFTKMLDIVEEFLSLKGGDGEKFRYTRLDGSTCRARRNLEIRLFNADERYKVMLLSTRAGGLGINLATASDVVLLESDWNPQADLQAQARAHRIGQTKEVTVYRLITQGTVEEQMMGRIRKKLYLSAKVTESMRDIHSSDTTITGKKGGRGRPRMSDEGDEMPNLTAGQLMSLVRRGAQAIAKPEIDPAEMLKWGWEEMVERTKDLEMTLEPNDEQKQKIKEMDKGRKDMEFVTPGIVVPAEQEDLEAKWLAEMEKVETRLFEGREHKKRDEEEHAKLVLDITRGARREGKERVVMVGRHAVLKETVGCGQWEAVATISGKGISVFSEPPKTKKEPFEHQDFCQICFDGGTIVLCNGCPRAYHVACLPSEFKARAKGDRIAGFYCPQHQCAECEQKTGNAGGMLFRCRWCENAYCEDCMDWDMTKLIGGDLIEMELYKYGEKSNAYWVKCVSCIESHTENPSYEKMCDDMERGWQAQMTEIQQQQEESKVELIDVEVQAEEEVTGVETPVSAVAIMSMSSTGVTTTAATSVGSNEDEPDVKNEDGVGSIPANRGFSRVSKRIAKTAILQATRTSQVAGKKRKGVYGVTGSVVKRAR